ncbi:hypothetical protein [Microbacterium maritypicum]
MAERIDKQDIVEAIADAIDDMNHDRIGYVLASSDSDEWGTLVIQTWPDGAAGPSVDFLARVTRIRSSR